MGAQGQRTHRTVQNGSGLYVVQTDGIEAAARSCPWRAAGSDQQPKCVQIFLITGCKMQCNMKILMNVTEYKDHNLVKQPCCVVVFFINLAK